MNCDFIRGCERGRISGDMYRQTDVTLRVACVVARRAGKHAVAFILGTACTLRAEQCTVSGNDTPTKRHRTRTGTPPLSPTAPVHGRILPELLGHTFSFLDLADEMASALANREWAYASLSFGRKNQQKLMNAAARGSDLVTMQYIDILKSPPTSQRPLIWSPTDVLMSEPIRSIAIMEWLIHRGADIDNAKDAALIWASKEGYLNVVRYLLEQHGADASTTVYEIGAVAGYHNAIQAASIYDHMDVVRYILSREETKRLLGSVLRGASMGGHLHIIKFLVTRGLNVSADASWDLSVASEFGHLDIVDFFLGHGIPVQSYNDQPLISASIGGHLDVVKFLLARGADMNARDGGALIEASRTGHPEVVDFFITHGLDVHVQEDKSMIEACGWGHLRVVEMLFAYGGDIRAQNNTALIVASRGGHLDVVKFLLDHDVDVHAQNNKALTEARKRGHQIVVALLESHISSMQ